MLVNMKKNITVHIIVLVPAVIAVFVIAQQTRIEVSKKEDLRTLSCGWPMEFVTSDQSWRDPPYPWEIRCLSRQWGDHLTIQWHSFYLNVLMFYLGFMSLWETCSFVWRRKKMRSWYSYGCKK